MDSNQRRFPVAAEKGGPNPSKKPYRESADAASNSISLEHFYRKNRDLLAERESAELIRSPGFAIDQFRSPNIWTSLVFMLTDLVPSFAAVR
jgi:hypothetical protein